MEQLTFFVLGMVAGSAYMVGAFGLAVWIGHRIKKVRDAEMREAREWHEISDIVEQSMTEVDHEQAAQA